MAHGILTSTFIKFLSWQAHTPSPRNVQTHFNSDDFSLTNLLTNSSEKHATTNSTA